VISSISFSSLFYNSVIVSLRFIYFSVSNLCSSSYLVSGLLFFLFRIKKTIKNMMITPTTPPIIPAMRPVLEDEDELSSSLY
jgi:hypothetical protein